jgi:hypothetical protein
MNVSLSFSGIEPSGQLKLRELFNAHARRLSGRLESDTPDLMRLEGRIEKDAGRNSLRVNLYLKFAGGVFVVTREGLDATTLLVAFDELGRRLDARVARARTHELRRGPAAGSSALASRTTAANIPASN